MNRHHVKIERQIRWDRYSEANPERHYYNILIINRPGPMVRTLQKLREQLTPVVEEIPIDSGLIKRSGGLHYDLRTIVSTVPEPEFTKVYGGPIKRDRRLQPRKTPEGWIPLIEDLSRGRIS